MHIAVVSFMQRNEFLINVRTSVQNNGEEPAECSTIGFYMPATQSVSHAIPFVVPYFHVHEHPVTRIRGRFKTMQNLFPTNV